MTVSLAAHIAAGVAAGVLVDYAWRLLARPLPHLDEDKP